MISRLVLIKKEAKIPGRLLVAMLFLVLGVSSATAQLYPDRSVRLVIPFAAGGALDVSVVPLPSSSSASRASRWCLKAG